MKQETSGGGMMLNGGLFEEKTAEAQCVRGGERLDLKQRNSKKNI